MNRSDRRRVYEWKGLGGGPVSFAVRRGKAEYLDGFRIRLAFSNGTAGTVDLRGRMEGPVFQPLNDVDTFRQFELTDHTLAWPNGADFAPEYLHDRVTQTEATNQAVNRSGRQRAL